MLRNKGYTIVEVLIATVITLLVVGMAYMLLIPTLRAASRGSVQSEMQEQSMLVMSLFNRDLDNAVPQGVSIDTQGQTAAIMPIQDVQGCGTLVWVTQFAVYSWDPLGQQVVRRVWYAPGPPDLGLTVDGSQPIRLTDAQMAQIASTTTLETRILATGVIAFTIQQSGPAPGVTDAVTLSIKLLRQAATGMTTPETYTSSRSLSFRNQY